MAILIDVPIPSMGATVNEMTLIDMGITPRLPERRHDPIEYRHGDDVLAEVENLAEQRVRVSRPGDEECPTCEVHSSLSAVAVCDVLGITIVDRWE